MHPVRIQPDRLSGGWLWCLVLLWWFEGVVVLLLLYIYVLGSRDARSKLT